MPEKYRVLVDMDGVLANFDKRLVEKWKEKWPDDPSDLLLDRDDFDVSTLEHLIKNAKQKQDEIYLAKGFCLSLKPIMKGLGFAALNKMAQLGHDVYILTSFGSKSMNAPSEKFLWVRDHMGPEWVKKTIVSRDKHVFSGDFLIDDKPSPNGEDKGASWEHIIYDQPFNRSVDSKRMIDWSNWEDVLPELLE